MKKILLFALLLFAIFASSLQLTLTRVSAAISPEINFQGKLTNPDGTNVSDGSYSIVFSIYNVASGGSAIWTEAQSSVTLSAGMFQVSLGSFTTLPGSVDFNSPSIYLGIKVGSDPEMTPRIQFTAAPYAFNSQQLNGLTSSNLVQLGQGLQTDSSLGNASIAINKTAPGNILDLQHASTAAFILSNNGSADFYDITGTTSLLATNATAGTVTSGNGTVTVGADGSISRVIAAGKTATSNLNSGSQSQFIAVDTQTDDLVTITNTGHEPTTDNANGEHITYGGGSAAVHGAGLRIDYTPGSSSGGTWNGLRVVSATNGAATGVKSIALQLEGPTSPLGGTNTAINVASGWDIGVDVQSGGLQLAAQTDPNTPAAGNLKIYAKDIAGRVVPKWVGPNGVDTPFQASLGFNRVAFSEPTGTANCSTGSTGFGSTSTGAGTCAAPALTSTNLLTSTRRITYSTSTTAGTVTYQKQSQLQVWRGNATGLGGFFYTVRFGTSTLAAGNRAFVGLSSSIANPTNVDPTTSPTISKVGLAINANTGNWNIATNASGTAPTLTNLGVNFPINTTSLYELVLFSAPNGSSVGWRVTNISTGAQTSGTATANLPTNTTFMAPQFWITNNTTAAAATIDFDGWYLESDN